MKFESSILSSRELQLPKGMQNARVFITDIDFKDENGTLYYMSGAGTSIDSDDGLFLSKMEAIERLCNGTPASQIIVDSYNNIKQKAVNISDFPNDYDIDEASNNKIFNPNEPIRWSQSYNLTLQKECYIPEEYINLFTRKKFVGEGITNPISTGAALHQNYTKATLNGIYEVIERDSISLTWLLKIPLTEIDLKTVPFDLNIFDNSYLGNVRLFNATTDTKIPTFCLLATFNYNEDIKNVMMFVSDSNVTKCLHKIKKELISVAYSLFENKNRFPNIADADFTEFKSVEQGALYMASSKKDSSFDFLKKQNKKPIKFNENDFLDFSNKDETIELKILASQLFENGHNIYVTDLTNKFAKFNNLKSVMVTIPSLQPISFVYSARSLNSQRLKNYSKKIYDSFDISKINNMPLAFS